MKKFFTLVATAFIALAAHAQVVFVDAEGKEYADGETMVITAEPDEWGDVFFEAPKLLNKGTETVKVKMDVNITELPEKTQVADCFSGSCVNYKTTGSHSTSTVSLDGGKTISTQIEWSNWNGLDYAEGLAVVEITLYVDGTKDKTVTVKYAYGEEASLGTVGSELRVVAAYSLTGQLVDPSTRGILLQKMSDGTIRKVINK